jgi:ribonuclease HI
MNIYSAYTDGSYDKNTSKASYGVVILKGNKIISKFNGVLKND